MASRSEVIAPASIPRLLDMRQAAAYLGLSYWSVRDYVLAGILPTVQLPPLRPREGERPRRTLRRVLIDVSDLDAFIARCKSGDAADWQSRASAESLEESCDCARSVPVRRIR